MRAAGRCSVDRWGALDRGRAPTGTGAAPSKALSSLLFGIKALDPITYLAASAALMVTALIACITPALAAVRTDPAVVLRQE